MNLIIIARRLLASAATTTLVASAISAPSFAKSPLPEPVTALLQKANIPADAMAVWAYPLTGNSQPLITHQIDRKMQPASTMKLVTTIVALDQLGRVHRGKTELISAGIIEGSVLKGALIIKGGADTDLDLDAFANMLKTLRQRGITHIDGDVVVDRTLFQPARLELGTPAFDEAPEFQYNVIPDALLLNFNLLSLELNSSATDLRASINTALEGVVVNASAMTLIDAACSKWDDEWKLPDVKKDAANGTITIHLKGAFPRNCKTTAQLNLLDKGDYIDRHFRAVWKQLGGTFSGSFKEAETPTTMPVNGLNMGVLAVHQGRTFAEVVRDINKKSDNALTRLAYLNLGVPRIFNSFPSAANTTPTLARAEAAVRAWTARNNIDSDGLVIENGSGLSRLERTSPQQLGSMLDVAWRSDYAPEFMSSLPVVALDGTMRNRLKLSIAAGRARLKTGTLRNVVALAGYVNDANNTPHVVVAMINHDNTPNGGARILDALIDWVAQSKPATTTTLAFDLGPQP